MCDPKKCLYLQFSLIMSICLQTSWAHLEVSTVPKVTILQEKLQDLVLTNNHGKNHSGFLGIPYARPPVENISWAQLEDITAPEVTILQGKLQGLVLTTNRGRHFSGFLGIPYAQPPVGNLRFANPVRAEGWSGTRNATIDMNVCPQFSETGISGDEDCLYLNVYTAQLPENPNASLLPVMVYIHGGAFTVGSGRSDIHNPGYLLDKDIVIVTPNYRLGALGFLSTGDHVASGNWALKDQVLALKWVQDNIKYFGGDPGRVTLFGQSAGSVSVSLLALSDSTIGLFHRYITQSGSALATWAYQPRAYYASRAFQLGRYVGCSNDTSDALITCLRKVDFATLLATNSQFLVWRNYPTIIWTPTDEPDIEGAVLTDSPTNLFANKGMHDLPWISGVVRDEGLMLSVAFMEDRNLFEDFLKNIDLVLPEILTLTYQPDSGAAWVNALKSFYFNNDLTTNRNQLLTNLTLLISDALFNYPAYNALQKRFNVSGNPEYFYTFNYRGTYSNTYFYGDSSVNYGVTHGDDNLYLYPPRASFASYNKTSSETDLKMVDIMVLLWTSFAINGTPTHSVFNDTAGWQPYFTEYNYIRIGNESDVQIAVQSSLLTERMRFWDELTSPSRTAAAAAVNSYSNLFIILSLVCTILVSSASGNSPLV